MGTKKAANSDETRAPDPDEGKPTEGAPLFPTASSDWIAVQVERLDPVEEEGFLGRLPITATEEQIRGRWGGGRFMCRAVNGQNQFKQNRTISIAGDPVFISEVNRQRWIRGQGRPNENAAAVAAPAAAPAQAFGVAEIVALFQGMQTAQAAQQQQWAQQMAEERRAREAAEQRREDARLAEERRRDDERRREDREREERRRQEEERAQARDREFMTTMINVVSTKQGGEAGQMAAFTHGITLALKLADNVGGGRRDDDDDDEEPADPIAETVRGLVKGIGEAVTGRTAPAPGPSPAPAVPTVAPGDPEPVTLTGPLAAQVGDFVRQARAAGKNPEALIASGIRAAANVMNKPANGAAAGVAAAAAAVRANENKPPAS